MRAKYVLSFKAYSDKEYDVYERHCGEGKGCFFTDEQYIGRCADVEEFVDKFNREINGYVEDFEVVEVESKASLKIDRTLKRRLDELKVHPRQPYNEVIRELLDEHDKR